MTDELCINTLRRASFNDSASHVQLLSSRLADMTAERDTLKDALDKALAENLRLRAQAKNPLPPAPKAD